MSPYRILLADDHVLFRQAISKAIEDTPGLEVCGDVSDGLQLMAALQESAPDLIILDLTMPHLTGLEAAREIKKLYPQVKILILTMHKSIGCLKGAFEIGANGYLLKEDAFGDLILAIQCIQQGKDYISPLVMGQVADFIQQEPQVPLNPKEAKVLALIGNYLSDEEIADQLAISIQSIRHHIMNLKKKLNLKTRAHLIRYGRETGYTEGFLETL